MSAELITIILFGSLLLIIFTGLPLVFGLGGIAIIFTIIFWKTGALYGLPTYAWNYGTNFVLLAVPLFIFMSSMLMKSGIADDLYEVMYQWAGGMRGGLSIGTVLICALMAAMVGISGAATLSMGLIALPSMLKHKYDKEMAMGAIAAGGALGPLIPPSTSMILLGFLAQLSVGKLFMGGIFSGLLLAILFIAYISIRCLIQPGFGPPVPPEERVSFKEKVMMLRKLALPVLLIIAVLGSIFTGIATPTESAAVGGLGSIICTAIYKRLNWRNLLDACLETIRLSGMVMWILIGAVGFTSLYTALGAYGVVEQILLSIPGGNWGTIIGMQLILMFLGCFLNPGGIIMITTPLFFPLIISMGFDPLWFGVIIILNMEMAYLTPPVGFNLFYMKAIVPPNITMVDIYKSVIPYIILQIVGLALCMIFPQIITWLPNTLIR